MFGTVGDIMSTVGDVMSFRGGVQYHGGYHDKREDILSTVGVFSTVGDIMIDVGGYHEYCGWCSVLWRYSNNKRLIIMSPHGTEHPHGTQDIPHGTQDIPHRLKMSNMVP